MIKSQVESKLKERKNDTNVFELLHCKKISSGVRPVKNNERGLLNIGFWTGVVLKGRCKK